MSRPSWRLGTLLFAVLLLGAALGYGAAALRVFGGRAPWLPSRKMHVVLLEKLDRELRFTPEQRERVRLLLDRKDSELRERRRAAHREMQRSREETRREIEQLLDERQRVIYRQMSERMRTRRGSRDTLDQGR